ncbi:gamma-glutamyltranspeptidase/glutathione hydrolase [Alkalihalobacillus xiaoxiensis]|uniref:Gamma-glutamyltranspeptidase/glutathione hydrolase n=1 Tax=Shouchella xiaoxiensis TaxID=766895 RepID=A0ABS2SPJ0_9BACI|nr:gamma-glutamyltransferase family protein [Shouchella xiaoxiensis]MBM7837437.1 gamma-glutamyltranspeptidase/glutathione hydrolase [Shouchella xiaoxiensis]
MNFDPHYHPYPSTRQPVYAKKGMVATSQPLAAQAGLDILKQGGNAVDAAIATAACLTVVEPCSNGIGGDAFALVWINDELHGLNGSGPAPASISIEKVKERGFDSMPSSGFIPVTVPGAPASWAALSERFGKLPLLEVLKPAITYAEEGFAITSTIARQWQTSFKRFKENHTAEEFASWFDTFAPNGTAPQAGDIWRSQAHADTLREIGETRATSFYTGNLAEKIGEFSSNYNGFLAKSDLAAYKPEWVKPIHVNYKGYDVWEIPPNGQGLIALQALSLLNKLPIGEKETIDTYHKQIEAIKLAFADGLNYITEETKMSVNTADLLSETYASERVKLIQEEALEPVAGKPLSSGTVYLSTADDEGNMVSFIQSNYMGFGSGLVVPGTGIALQNRGHNFSLHPEHDNRLEPNKRTFHTIIPGFLTKNGAPIGPFGVMGGFMQPQGHVQVVMNTVDFHLHPQAALDSPRWQWMEGKKVMLEPNFPRHIAEGLARRGHQIVIANDSMPFGRGQIIWYDADKQSYIGGTESRTDSAIAPW